MSDPYTINITGSNNETNVNLNEVFGTHEMSTKFLIGHDVWQPSDISFQSIHTSGFSDMTFPCSTANVQVGGETHEVQFWPLTGERNPGAGAAAGTRSVITAFDTKTLSILWTKENETIFDNTLFNQHIMSDTTLLYPGGPSVGVVFTAPSYGAHRNTPFVDSKGLVWIACNVYGQKWVAALNSSTGEVVKRVDLQAKLLADDPSRNRVRGNDWRSLDQKPFFDAEGIPFDDIAGGAWSQIRTGCHVEYDENDNCYLYVGETGIGDGNFINFTKQNDIDVPAWHAQSGHLYKLDVTHCDVSTNMLPNIVWKFRTMPEVIQPTADGLQIPIQCFRRKADGTTPEEILYNKIPLKIGRVFSANPQTSGDLSGVTIDVSQNLVIKNAFYNPAVNPYGPTWLNIHIDFAEGEDLSGTKSYTYSYTNPNTSTVETAQITGNQLVQSFWDMSGDIVLAKNPNMMEVKVGHGYVLKDDMSGSLVNPLSDARYIAYNLNYFGASVWAQGFVLTDDYIVFGSGQMCHVPYDEYKSFILSGKYSTHKQTMDKLGNAYQGWGPEFSVADYVAEIAANQVIDIPEYSPRGRRSLGSTVICLNKQTGLLQAYSRASIYDIFTYAYFGGLGAFSGNAPIFGNAGGKPWSLETGVDNDLGAGVSKLLDANGENPRCLAFGKSGSGAMLHLPKTTDTGVLVFTTGNQDVGIESYNLTTEMAAGTSTGVTYGYSSVLGGTNFGQASNDDYTRAYGVVTNSSLNTSFMSPPLPDWETADGQKIPLWQAYVVAVDYDGAIQFNTPIARGQGGAGGFIATMPTAIIYKNGKVWTAQDWHYDVNDFTQTKSYRSAFGIDAVTGIRTDEIDLTELQAVGRAPPAPIDADTLIMAPGRKFYGVGVAGNGKLHVIKRSKVRVKLA